MHFLSKLQTLFAIHCNKNDNTLIISSKKISFRNSLAVQIKYFFTFALEIVCRNTS